MVVAASGVLRAAWSCAPGSHAGTELGPAQLRWRTTQAGAWSGPLQQCAAGCWARAALTAGGCMAAAQVLVADIGHCVGGAGLGSVARLDLWISMPGASLGAGACAHIVEQPNLCGCAAACHWLATDTRALSLRTSHAQPDGSWYSHAAVRDAEWLAWLR